jgi:hypothetical protein
MDGLNDRFPPGAAIEPLTMSILALHQNKIDRKRSHEFREWFSHVSGSVEARVCKYACRLMISGSEK